MAQLELRQVHKSFGDASVIHNIDLHVDDGEFCVFVGPSGCGKSTLLRLIAGLEESTSGQISIGGKDVTALQPARRGIAMVFQSYALYPHMNVAENMGFGLRMANVPKAHIETKVRESARILQIEHLLGRRPKDLSGGQRQRVAIGRAIVREPSLFLFDEPLSNLDAALRVEMRLELARIKEEVGTTFVYVTHDQVEAMTLADKIVVLRDGKVEQVGRPLDLYRHPANKFVAGFIGSPKMNFIEVTARPLNSHSVEVYLPAGRLRVPTTQPIADQNVTLGVRPEHTRIVAVQDAALTGTVNLAERLGSETFVYVKTAAGTIMVKLDGATTCGKGDTVGLAFIDEEVHLFDGNGLRVSAS
ncbi:ABC transporter ATP-binding protein [Paraburkholderia sp. J12]|uniref:ABC transporter ATP-binding protein n=1 Tax=Paraburkholderia sp. J12 TaxID=2805432 RepID=UPI002ABD981C|nr:ABC transporter ATP-binding protein [Paraburkholderia sp. J12]